MLTVLLAAAAGTAMPSAAEVGTALAVSYSCTDTDGFTLCDPNQPIGSTFQQILCVVYGADAEHRPIVRCVFKGAQWKRPRGRDPRSFDGAIDVIYLSGTWLPAH